MVRKQIKVIKLDLEVYKKLDQLRGKRESFSQAVNRLIDLHEQIEKLADELSPGAKSVRVKP